MKKTHVGPALVLLLVAGCGPQAGAPPIDNAAATNCENMTSAVDSEENEAGVCSEESGNGN